jgi:hypothetical protein
VIPFVGVTRKFDFVLELRRRHIGRMFVRKSVKKFTQKLLPPWMHRSGAFERWQLFQGERWAYDNGAFADAQAKQKFNERVFFHDIDFMMEFPHRPYLVIAPDRWQGGMKSFDMTLSYADRLPTELPWYFAAQDGQDIESVREVLLDPLLPFRGLFLGGSDKFKGEAYDWVMMGHECGVPVHFGRASTPKKMAYAHNIGCDSFDTAFPLWTAERFQEFLNVVDTCYAYE